MSNKPSDTNEMVVVLSFFSKLVGVIRKLPAVLAYSGAIAIAIVVAVILRAVFPREIVVLLGVIILAGLVAFVWNSRKRQRVTLYVVVHKEKDKTHLIPGAEVTLALPDPQIKHTDTNGSAVFASIPGEYVGRKVAINATEPTFEERSPEEWRIVPDLSIYLSLVPRPVAESEDHRKPKGNSSEKQDEKPDVTEEILFGTNNTKKR